MTDDEFAAAKRVVKCGCGLCLSVARDALAVLVADVPRLRAIEAAVRELRAVDEAWLRRHPHYQRPKGAMLPHDKLYALLDAKELG